ncbi:MAG TPA: hypothetical protein VI136_07055, partial [Verrucomicrobiae bacterium]
MKTEERATEQVTKRYLVSGRKRVFFEVARDTEGGEDAISDGFCASHRQNHQDSPTTVTLLLT